MYIFLYFFLLFLYILLKKNKNKKSSRQTYIIVATIILSLVSALRHKGVGIDTFAYYMSYSDIQNTTWSDITNHIFSFFQGAVLKDPGYSLFNKICATILGPFEIYLFFVALFFLSALGYILYHSVEHLFGYVISYSYYISLFYGFFPNSAIRQTVAMSFLLWAVIIYHKKHRFVIPAILFLFAFLIHKSVLFGLVPLCFLLIKNVKFIYRSALIITPLLFAVSLEFVRLLVLLSEAEHYMQYIEGEGGTSVVFIVEMCFFYLIGFAALKFINKERPYTKLAFISFALAISIISFIRVDPSLQRLIAYFSIWGMVFLPNALYYHKPFVRRILIICVFALCIGRSVLIPTPYKFFWQYMNLSERYDEIYRFY